MRKRYKRLDQGNAKTPAHLKKIIPQKQNSTGGRPTLYDKQRHPQMAYLIISNFGSTLEQLAPILGVEYATIKLWSFKHSPFRDAIKHGRWEWSMDSVEASLTKRAIGYEVIEVTEEEMYIDVPKAMLKEYADEEYPIEDSKKSKGKKAMGLIEEANKAIRDKRNGCDRDNTRSKKIKLPGTKITRKTKHVAASVSAILFFLQNRAPEDWKHVRHIEQNVNFKNTPMPDFVGQPIEINPREKVAEILKGLPEEKLEKMRQLHAELSEVAEQIEDETGPVEADDMEDIFNEVVTGAEEED